MHLLITYAGIIIITYFLLTLFESVIELGNRTKIILSLAVVAMYYYFGATIVTFIKKIFSTMLDN